MKITKSALRQLIREQISISLRESAGADSVARATMDVLNNLERDVDIQSASRDVPEHVLLGDVMETIAGMLAGNERDPAVVLEDYGQAIREKIEDIAIIEKSVSDRDGSVLFEYVPLDWKNVG